MIVVARASLIVAVVAAGVMPCLGPRAAVAQQAPQPDPAVDRIVLTAGRSTVVGTTFDITRIAVTNPAVADAVVVQPREILVDGKGSGTVSLIIWGATERRQFDVVVEPGVSTLEQRLQALFPGEDIHVGGADDAIVLSGSVSSNAVMLRAGEIAAASASKAKVINMLALPSGTPSQQVMLQVRFAEVNRRAVKELGASFVSTGRISGRTTTQQFSAPNFEDGQDGGLTFSDFLNLFLFDRQEGLGVLIKALEQKGHLQSLAEPNLIAYNGQEASFLAGGEFPVPIVQGGSAAQVTIQFKEFGIRLNFTPTIAGDTIRLKVRPEVSALDFANGITLSGFRVPALITRRVETDVELRDGQTFAVAGLLNNLTQTDAAAIPILSKIPIIGNFFKSKADRAEQTELLVLITPRLVRPLDPDEVPTLPTDPSLFLPSETMPSGAPATSRPPER